MSAGSAAGIRSAPCESCVGIASQWIACDLLAARLDSGSWEAKPLLRRVDLLSTPLDVHNVAGSVKAACGFVSRKKIDPAAADASN